MHKLTEQQRQRVAQGKTLVEQMIADTQAGVLKASPYLQDKFDSETGTTHKPAIQEN